MSIERICKVGMILAIVAAILLSPWPYLNLALLLSLPILGGLAIERLEGIR